MGLPDNAFFARRLLLSIAPTKSHPIVVPAPVLHRFLDIVHREALVSRLTRHFDEFFVGGEPEGDDLLDAEAMVEQFAGHGEMAKILLRANRPVLRLQREDAPPVAASTAKASRQLRRKLSVADLARMLETKNRIGSYSLQRMEASTPAIC
jgi:hypothetical protein